MALSRGAFGLFGIIAVLTACNGGSQSSTFAARVMPRSVSTVLPVQLSGCCNAGTNSSRESRPRSWMLPEAAKASSLLYVTNSGNGTVTVYSYHAGADLKLVGSLAIPEPSGVCSDKNGNVWIGSQHGRALHKFAHGGTKPIRLIKLGQGFPAGCVVDRTSGNLAVAINHPHTKFLGHFGYVDVFSRSSPYPTQYVFAKGFYSVAFPAYDDKGNLFVDGTACTDPSYCYAPPSQPPGLFELRKGGSEFSELDLKGVAFNEPAGLAWIKPTLLVTDSDPGSWVGYKMLVSGSTATLVRTIPFDKVAQASGVSVRAGVAIVADIAGQGVRTYSISDGGPVGAVFKDILSPYAVAVSQKP